MSEARKGAGAHAAETTDSVARLRSGPSIKPAAPRGGRVLVIDDEHSVGRTIQRLLADRHEVTLLTSGAEAIELLAGGADFDVVLCDLTMPDVNGTDVYHRATELRPELAERFVFMTGGTYTAAARAFLDVRGRARIDKPFDLNELRNLVAERVLHARQL
jgi:CheY-like chemotaxis protein